MALKNYRLYAPSRVIEVDKRSVAVSWQNHLNRTSGLRPGVDLVAVVGTPIYAPTDGYMERRPNDGGAGHSCRFWHDDNPGWADVFSHLSAYAGADGQHFDQGEIVAWSGATGGVAQHLHRHLLDPQGVRRNPWDYFTPRPVVAAVRRLIKVATPAARTTTSTTKQDDEDSMFLIHIIKGASNGKDHKFALSGRGYWAEFTGQAAANGIAARYGRSTAVNAAQWAAFKAASSK